MLLVMNITLYLNAIFFRNKTCQYLPKYYYIRPNVIKYHDLFCSMNITLLNTTCKFLDNIMKTFVPPVNLVLLYYICITFVLYCTYCYYVLMYHLLCDLSINKDMFCSVHSLHVCLTITTMIAKQLRICLNWNFGCLFCLLFLSLQTLFNKITSNRSKIV